MQRRTRRVLIGAAARARAISHRRGSSRGREGSGAEAIHPGYGFLSENADFAEACRGRRADLRGPPAPAIRAMGSKDRGQGADGQGRRAGRARLSWRGAGTEPSLRGEAEIGFPVLIKAVAGGGGKGMRVVECQRFESAARSASARRPPLSATIRVLIEKFVDGRAISRCRCSATAMAHVVHLFERECSLQRRHQKVIEEAPAPALTMSGARRCMRPRR